MKLSDTVERKFIEELNVDDWEIETDSGWQDLSAIKKTIPYEMWRLTTASGMEFMGADTHILYDENMDEKFLKDFLLGDKIQTDKGLDTVTHVESLGYEENMYDVEVVDENHRFYCNGFLSHNSITSIGFFLWYTLFNEYKTIAILANKGDSARGLLARYRIAYEHLPTFLQQGVVEWNKGSVELENGCTILAGSTSSSAVRSKSINILFLDEFAFVPTNLADDFFKSVYPTITSGQSSKVIIVSTANGMNHFHKMWIEAERGENSYIPVRVDWWQVPGRDEQWKINTIKDTSEEQFSQEFGNSFLGTAGTLINPTILKTLTHSVPILEEPNLKIYDKSKLNHTYVITVDGSEGLGLDNSVATVFDVTAVPYEQVAVYRSAEIDPHLFPDVIIRLADLYNGAFVLVELNSTGELVANILYQDLEYENLLTVTVAGRKGQVLGGGFSGRTQLGIKTSKQTKRIGCSVLKTLIENGKLVIKDHNTISELTTFVQNKQSYEAEPGHNDDIVMTMVLFSWMTNQQYFKDEMDQNIRNFINKKHIDEIEESLVPFGHISGGPNDGDIVDSRYDVNQSEIWIPQRGL